ncbi:hypothetical protein REC12_07425 [Desulfosporosinus sp. PR]|uniref:hypothetical protein n=1 Tax=Candidatus Desulfosporosinus nitrosoreducens TaxID=3401928 RepID=UPI0027FE5331|nr:hypothetical protein [Desulfosporosinus sp. PR]MDQ7093416.1 hypothetical protein [Desulfosporosinus sp. PR]
MKIERIKISRIKELEDVDWIFPAGPAFLWHEKNEQQRILGRLLLELFYQKRPHLLRAEGRPGLLEAWVAGENTRFYIQKSVIPQGKECGQASTLVTELITGQTISPPESISWGEYIFGVNLQSFSQGVVVDWPKNSTKGQLRRRIENLRQGGDEEVSLADVQASLAGAEKKVSEQMGRITLLQAEYAALRRDWEAARRRQDEERLLQIEIKKLLEQEAVLSEKIESAILLQERLALLSQNPDYRQLRQLETEIIQLEEQLQKAESTLTILTSNPEIDWSLLEVLREECLEWANLQEEADRLVKIIQMRSEEIVQLQGSLETCGYREFFPKDVQRLRRAVEEKDAAEKELGNLADTKAELESFLVQSAQETARLQEFKDLADLTEADKARIRQWERQLEKWQGSKLASSFDRVLRAHFQRTSFGEKLASRLARYYERYQVSGFEELISRQQSFLDLQVRVEKIDARIEELRKKLARETSLQNIVYSRTKLLDQAFLTARVNDFPAWLSGWKDYQIKKRQLSSRKEELQFLFGESAQKENNLLSVTERLREKLSAWETTAASRDEVLAAVFKVAAQLRIKEEAEKKIAELSGKFEDLLGPRDMKALAGKLEPLAELEHEARVPENERLKILTAWQKEQAEIRKLRGEAEKRLPTHQNYPSLSVLEEKIESVKREWQTYESLRQAISSTQGLLEASWQEWQGKYGNLLNYEMNRLVKGIFSLPDQERQYRDDQDPISSDYFAYRMAMAELTLGSCPDLPLLFSIGEIKESEGFWDKVMEFLTKLSLERQVIFSTTDFKLGEKFRQLGWLAPKS